MTKSSKYPNEERADKINQLIDALEELDAIEIVPESMEEDENERDQTFQQS